MSRNLWKTETLICSAQTYYQEILSGLAVAKDSIELEAYIFEQDSIGQQVTTALIAAAARGVQVRVLVDGIGSYYALDWLIECLNHPGIELKVYHPVPWRLKVYRFALTRRHWLQQCLLLLLRLNHRNHRKLCVVDRQVAWVGSINICESHLPDRQPPWRDLAVRLEGEGVEDLSEDFATLWRRYLRPEPRLGRFQQFRTNLSPLSRLGKNRALIRLMNGARQRLWIENAYFSPSASIVRAIKRAAQRGVDVRLIVSAQSDIRFFPALTATYYSDLLKQAVSVFEYQTGIIHAKAMLIDEQAVIGSSNMNHRSLLHDLELDVLLNQPDTIRQLADELAADMQRSEQVGLEDMPRYQLNILMGWLPRLLRYWF